MKNKEIEEIMEAENTQQQSEWSKRLDKLTHHYEPIPNSKGSIVPYIKRDEVLKFIIEEISKVHNSAIEGCEEMIKDEFIPPNYEGKPIYSELEMFLKQKLENLKIK